MSRTNRLTFLSFRARSFDRMWEISYFIWLSFRTHVRNLCFSGSCHSEWIWGIPGYCFLECSGKFIYKLSWQEILHSTLFRSEWHVIPSEAGRPTRNLLLSDYHSERMWEIFVFRGVVIPNEQSIVLSNAVGSSYIEFSWQEILYFMLFCSERQNEKEKVFGNSISWNDSTFCEA